MEGVQALIASRAGGRVAAACPGRGARRARLAALGAAARRAVLTALRAVLTALRAAGTAPGGTPALDGGRGRKAQRRDGGGPKARRQKKKRVATIHVDAPCHGVPREARTPEVCCFRGAAARAVPAHSDTTCVDALGVGIPSDGGCGWPRLAQPQGLPPSPEAMPQRFRSASGSTGRADLAAAPAAAHRTRRALRRLGHRVRSKPSRAKRA